jgi:hypothetical protein
VSVYVRCIVDGSMFEDGRRRKSSVGARRNLKRRLRTGGWALIGIAALLYVALEWSSHVEQARTPGVESFGVAVLFIIFATPAVAFALTGAALLLVARVLKDSP